MFFFPQSAQQNRGTQMRKTQHSLDMYPTQNIPLPLLMPLGVILRKVRERKLKFLTESELTSLAQLTRSGFVVSCGFYFIILAASVLESGVYPFDCQAVCPFQGLPRSTPESGTLAARKIPRVLCNNENFSEAVSLRAPLLGVFI